MTHPTDLELIDHFLGRGPVEVRERVKAQLTALPELRQRQAELTAVWDLLGKAETELTERDLWPAVDEEDMTFHVETYLEFDLDGDGVVDGAGTFRGDFNCDGTADGTDLSIMAGSYAGPAGFAGGNANGDSIVNGTDLSILAKDFGSVASAAIPRAGDADDSNDRRAHLSVASSIASRLV